MKKSPVADLAPAHAGVPALRGGGVDAVDEWVHPGGSLSWSGGRVPAPMAVAIAGSETVLGPFHWDVQQNLEKLLHVAASLMKKKNTLQIKYAS